MSPTIDGEALEKLGTTILRDIVKEYDTDAICSQDTTFWCDVVGINPVLFRKEFRRRVRKNMKELEERRENDKEREETC